MREDGPTLMLCPRCEGPGSPRPKAAGYWCETCNLAFTGTTAEWEAEHPDELRERRRLAELERQRVTNLSGAAAARAALEQAGQP